MARTKAANYSAGPWTMMKRNWGPGESTYFYVSSLADPFGSHAITSMSDDAGSYRKSDPREVEANARLIAAAPEMLAALKVAESQMVLDGYLSYPSLATVRAAIAKAEGHE